MGPVLIESHVLFTQKQYDNAVKLLTEELTNTTLIDELDQVYRLRGECYMKLNKFKDAISDLEHYFGNVDEIQGNEENFRPIIALANSYLQTDEIIKTASLLLKAAEIKPQDDFVKITLSAITLEYFGNDTDAEIRSLLIKGKLFSKITNLISPDNSIGLAKGIQDSFVDRFQDARQRKPNMVMMDVINIGSSVTTEMFDIWEKNVAYLNNIHKSYLGYEVAKKIHSFNFFKMDLDELHKSVFQPAYLLYKFNHPDLSKFKLD